MRNKMLKITISLLVLLTLIVVVTLPAMAFDIPVIEPQDPGGTTKSDIETAGGKIAGLVSVIAAAVAIVILICLAIKYMTAAPSEKADIKKSAVTYVIGAVLLFAASGVLGIIATFGKEIFSSSGGGESNYEKVPGGTLVTGTGE